MKPIQMLRLALPLALIAPAIPVQAQTAEPLEARLRRIEGELRALQRKVFPDGAGRVFAPEITPGATAAPPPAAASNAPALADVLTRLDAVEAQLRNLTASSEETQHRLGKAETRLDTLEAAASAAAAAAATPAPPPAPVAEPAAAPARGDRSPPAPKAAPAASAGRAAAVAAIVRPSSDDKAEDTYSYAYRLWEAKFFPEAQAALLDFVQRYPNHKRISYARNLLGRAYLDDNKPGAAAQWFADNYRADKAGERAPDSLLYLAVAMARLKETKRACTAIAEFRDVYPGLAADRLKGQFDAVTKMVACH